MINPTTQQLEACARLQNSEPAFIELLESRLNEYRNYAVEQRDEVPMRWAQGRAQEVMDLLKLIRNAPEYLRKARR